MKFDKFDMKFDKFDKKIGNKNIVPSFTNDVNSGSRNFWTSNVVDFIFRICVIGCLISLSSHVIIIRDDMAANTFIGVSGDDDGSTCSINFETNTKALGIPLGLVIGFVNGLIFIELIFMIFQLWSSKQHFSFGQVICDFVLYVIYWFLLIGVIIGWMYTFPVEIVENITIYFTLQSLSESAALLGCSFNIDELLGTIYTLIGLVVARSALCLTVYTGAIRGKEAHNQVDSFEPVETSSSHNGPSSAFTTRALL